MAFKTILTLAACVAAFSAMPVYADSVPVEGVVIAILGDSDRVDLLPGQTIIFRPEAGKLTFIRFVEGPMEPEEGELNTSFSITVPSSPTNFIVSLPLPGKRKSVALY